jgi:hypothetical protein
LIDDGYGFFLEFTLFDSNVKKEICDVLEFSFRFKKYEKKIHNILSLMLDPKFKSLHFMFSFIDCEEGVCIVE